MNFALNYCGICGDFLGPDDFDGICLDCEATICEGCGEIMIKDGLEADGDDKYRCPFCAPATAGEKRLNGAIVQANDEIGNISIELSDLLAQLATVTAERDALKAWRDAVPVAAIKFYVNNTEPDYDLMAYWEDNVPAFNKAKNAIIDWLRKQV